MEAIKMKQILLINSKTRGPCRPTGLEYLAEGLVEAGYEVHFLDLTLKDITERTVEEWLTNNHCDAVGISIFNTQWDKERDRVDFFLPEIRDMVSDIKKMTKAPVILGGYGFSMQPEDILEYVGGDFGVAGCGIPALPNLLEGIKQNAVETGTIVREHDGKYLDIEFKRNFVIASFLATPNTLSMYLFMLAPRRGVSVIAFIVRLAEAR
jgi:radical SAM superfamily enzyme YgiQ (UPF0313 family)